MVQFLQLPFKIQEISLPHYRFQAYPHHPPSLPLEAAYSPSARKDTHGFWKRRVNCLTLRVVLCKIDTSSKFCLCDLMNTCCNCCHSFSVTNVVPIQGYGNVRRDHRLESLRSETFSCWLLKKYIIWVWWFRLDWARNLQFSLGPFRSGISLGHLRSVLRLTPNPLPRLLGNLFLVHPAEARGNWII